MKESCKFKKANLKRFSCPRCGEYVMTWTHVEKCCGKKPQTVFKIITR